MNTFDKLKNRLLQEDLITEVEYENLTYNRVYGSRWHMQDGGINCFFIGEGCRIIESYDTVGDLLKSKSISMHQERGKAFIGVD